MVWWRRERKIRLRVVELEEEGVHIVCRNGSSSKHWWIIDTGASTSVIDEDFTDQLEIQNKEETLVTAGIKDSNLQTQYVEVENISLGTHVFRHTKAIKMPLTHINQIYQDCVGIEICGIIGCDFLARHRATIDLNRENIIIPEQSVKH